MQRAQAKWVRAKAPTLEPDPVLKHHAVGRAGPVLRIASVQDGNLADCARLGCTVVKELVQRAPFAWRCFLLAALAVVATPLRLLWQLSIASGARQVPNIAIASLGRVQ